MRLVRAIALVGGLVLALGACALPLTAPGDTSQIALVSSATTNGWRFDYYRNHAYPCSISGYQTFVVATRVGSSPSAAAPLYVWLHGGGIGWFDDTGTPQPDTDQMTEQGLNGLRGGLTNPGLATLVRNDLAGFRMLSVSYCDRDLYSGGGGTDPNNPNPTDDGQPKTTNGLLATKAAIQFTQSLYPTTKTFVAGGSAGSAGAYYVGWALQEQGIPPAGIVGDASVVNAEQGAAAFDQGVCANPAYGPASSIVQQRLQPDIGSLDNEVDKLVASGRLTVPILHIWNHGDQQACGSAPMHCPLRDGSTTTMGANDCIHQPLQATITAEGPTSRSRNLPLCVDADGTPNCSLHVVTTHDGLVNTDPASPADYNAAVLAWIDARLADP